MTASIPSTTTTVTTPTGTGLGHRTTFRLTKLGRQVAGHT